MDQDRNSKDTNDNKVTPINQNSQPETNENGVTAVQQQYLEEFQAFLVEKGIPM